MCENELYAKKCPETINQKSYSGNTYQLFVFNKSLFATLQKTFAPE